MRLLVCLLLGSSLLGCGNEEERQKLEAKLEETQKAADKRVAKVELDAQNKLADTQKQLDDVKKELDETKLKLEAAQKAEAGADEKDKLVEAALHKAREAFKAEGRSKLGELNREVTEVSQKSAKAPAAVKTAVTKLIQKVPAQQKAIAKDLADYDAATLETLSTVRAKLEKDLAIMRANVRAAKAKVP